MRAEKTLQLASSNPPEAERGFYVHMPLLESSLNYFIRRKNYWE
jgi:hypothetical protein